MRMIDREQPRRAVGLLGGLSLASLAILAIAPLQLAAIITVLQIGLDFTCIGETYETACVFLKKLVGRGVVVLALMALYGAARWVAVLALLRSRAPDDGGWKGWAAVQMAGFAAILAPVVLFDPAAPGFFVASAPFWFGGAALAGVGAVFWLAPARAWGTLMRRDPLVLTGVILMGLLLPEVVGVVNPLWSEGWLARLTFSTVAQTLTLAGAEPFVNAERFLIGTNGFVVQVAATCSGVQGFALMAAFILTYAAVFRDSTRFPHFWILLPIGILVSWIFNVLRIVTLIAIGASGQPGLAVNGFHSHAGWLFFTLIALGVVATARVIPWMTRRPAIAGPSGVGRAGPPPLLQDPMAAQILPFVVFMFSALVASTLVETPAVAYPLRAAAMAAALWLFREIYRGMEWRIDPLALGAGAALGAAWVLTAPPAAEADADLALALAAASPAFVALWVASRIAGTTFLVPLIEELFFRGYVLGKFQGGAAIRIAGLLVSSALFAALHDRWIAAALAGVLFGLLALRRGRLCDAVVAHAAANAVIAACAVATGEWRLI